MRPPPHRTDILRCGLAAAVGLTLGFLAACGPIVGWPITSCTRDSDCGLETLECNTATGECEEKCSPLEHLCPDGRCARCCGDGDCDPDKFCGAAGTCLARCSPLEHLCNGNRCARCCDDGECATDQRCDAVTGTCQPRCSSGLLFCNGACRQCCSAGDCRTGEVCELDAGTCLSLCPGQRFCPSLDGGVDAGTCAQCCADLDCGGGDPGSGFICDQGACRCGSGRRACAGACIALNLCCASPNDCEGLDTCDAGVCCDYYSEGDGGLGAGGCQPWL